MTPDMAMDEARSIGMEEERTMDDLFQTAAPTGKFSATALNSLVGAFNEVLVTMGIPEPYPEFDAGTRALPGDLVRGLAMVADATTSTGTPNPVNLEKVKDDTDLELLAGKLMNLAEDEDFAAQMTAMPEDDGSDMLAEEPAMDDPAMQTEAVDDEALFMQRM